MELGMKRFMVALLGLVLALGLMPGLGAKEALAADDTYTLKVAVVNEITNEHVSDLVDGNYVLGTKKQLTVSVSKNARSYFIPDPTPDNIVNLEISGWSAGQATASVAYSVTSSGGCARFIHFRVGNNVDVTRYAVHVECTKNSSDVPVTDITLDKADAELAVGDTLKLNATVLPDNATHPDLDWGSSDLSVATVDGAGIVTAVGAGKTTVTAKSTDGSGKFASCEITVTKPVPVTGIAVDKTAVTLNVGEKAELSATVSPEEASQEVDWESSDHSVATVLNGEVTAVSAGTVTITAKSLADTAKTATCTVTVVDPSKPSYAAVSGAGSSWAKGGKDGLAITFKRTAAGEEKDATFSHFKSASVDGKELTRDKDYTAKEGSVVVTLDAAYLESLSAGEHTLTATFDDGSADAKFTVTKAAAASSSKSALAKTGDAVPVAACLAVIAIAAGALLVARRRLG